MILKKFILCIYVSIILAAGICCRSYQETYSRINEAYTPYDSVGFIFDTYKYYVGTSTIKKIELLRLPFPITSDKRYISYDEAIKYYYANGMIEVARKLSVARTDKEQYYQQQIEYGEFQRSLLGSSSSFGISESEAKFYKKYRVQSLKDLEFYCYSATDYGHDSFRSLAEAEKIQLQIIQEKYGVGLGLRDLIFSKKYNNRRSDTLAVDRLTKTLIESALTETINMLSAEQKETVKNLKLSFESDESNSTLWLSTNGKYVFISPLLIRAIYVYTLSRFPSLFYDTYYRNLNSVEMGRQSLSDIRFFNNELLQGFKSAFYFVFNHELAHTYFSRPSIKDNVQNEIICDCGAYRTLKSKRSTVNAGVFTLMLEESVKAGLTEIWGSINPEHILKRVKYLEDLNKGLIEPDCDKIPNSYYQK